MQYREIIAVCSQIHTKHINTQCGQNVELLHVKPGGTYSNHRSVTYSTRTEGTLAVTQFLEPLAANQIFRPAT